MSRGRHLAPKTRAGRVTWLSLGLALGLFLAMSIPAGAESRTDKIELCHVTAASDPIPTFHPTTDLRMFYPGKVIRISVEALTAHEDHGDSATLGAGDGQYRTDQAGLDNLRISAENNDLRFWDEANCFVTRTP
jgi:hypothetical protein